MDLSTFFERLPLATYRLSMCAEVLYINAEFARLHGYSAPPELLLQLDSHTLNCFASPQQGAEFHNQLLATGTVRNFITQWIRHRTGDLLWVRMNAHLVRDANQTPHCYEGTAEDISAEHARNIAQREHETMLFNLLQAIPDQIWLKSLYGSYLACNQHFAQTLGRPAADIIGTVDADYPCAAMASHYFVSDETVIRTGKYASYEVEVRTSNDLGSDTFEIIKAPVRNASGTVTGVLGMARNISLRKYSEARLRDATNTCK